jgi:prepilin-type N-terminal cleavage/methylation domain-containing protein/prepilin-type processing-associated H-X9-DG protein
MLFEAKYPHVGWRGFSLIELLIVAALILTMFVMTYGSRTRSRQQRQLQQCNRNLQSVFVALDIFANEHAGFFPVVTNAPSSEVALAGLVPRYTSTTSAFICPASGDGALANGESFEQKKISYAYYMGRRRAEGTEPVMSDEQVDAQPKIKGRPLFSTDGKGAGNNHEGRGGNLLFADGRAEKAGAIAPSSLLLTPGVTLLNPKR